MLLEVCTDAAAQPLVEQKKSKKKKKRKLDVLDEFAAIFGGEPVSCVPL